MTANLFLLIAVAMLSIQPVFASALDDLSSPSQETRDRAAAELRRTFRSTPASKWTPTLDKIKKGQSKKEILGMLGPSMTNEGSLGSTSSHMARYRLDHEWMLYCRFKNEGDILIECQLSQMLDHIWTPPPQHFTGIWVVYFVNGQKSDQINYKDGKYFGESISYRSDGSTNFVQHYNANGCDGADTGFFPSGKIHYRGQYKAGKRVGTWTVYDESGKITNTEEHGAP